MEKALLLNRVLGETEAMLMYVCIYLLLLTRVNRKFII